MNPNYEHRRPCDGCDLYRGDALEVLPRLAAQGLTADMIFADPPYDKNLVNDTISFIFHYQLLAAGGLVIMEHSRHEDISENPLYSIIREKSYGKETRVSLICRRQEGE